MIRKLLLSAAAVTALSFPALAEDIPTNFGPGTTGEKGMPHSPNVDTDGDGMLSKAEFMAVQEKRFTSMDGNNDGKISPEERESHHEKMKAEFREKRKEWESKKGDKGDATPPVSNPAPAVPVAPAQ
jgi:uncharacterized membrane protein